MIQIDARPYKPFRHPQYLEHFTLQFKEERTIDLLFSISAENMKQELEALDSITTVSVEEADFGVHGGKMWTIEFIAIEGEEYLPLFADDHLLLGNIDVNKDCPSTVATNTESYAGAYGEDFIAYLECLETTHADVTYVGSGQYAVSSLTPRVGEYSLHVSKAISGGLKGSYFNNRWLFGDTPAMERIDPVIDFTWDDFVTSTGKDFISVRWTGYVQPAFSEAYTFHMQVNDGVRLWIDGIQLIDEYEATVEGVDFVEYSAVTTSLVADRLYSVKIEFRENKDLAVARFLWSSITQPKTVVPPHRLFYASTPIVDSPFTVVPTAIEPPPPIGLTLQNIDQNTLLAEWYAPSNDGGDEVDGFLVEWWETGQHGDTEIQALVLTGATGGEFSISYGGSSILRPIKFSMDSINKVVNAIEVGLEGVPGQNVGDVDVTYEVDSSVVRIFIEFLSNAGVVPSITTASENLEPNDATIIVCSKDSRRLPRRVQSHINS